MWYDYVDDLDHKASRVRRLLGPKKGLAVHFGHEDWNMVGSTPLKGRWGHFHVS